MLWFAQELWLKLLSERLEWFTITAQVFFLRMLNVNGLMMKAIKNKGDVEMEIRDFDYGEKTGLTLHYHCYIL